MHRTRVARAHRDGPQGDCDVNRWDKCLRFDLTPSNVARIARCSRRKFSIAFCVHVLWISFQLLVGRCARTRPQFSLGQHKALVRAHDVHTVSPPGRVSTLHSILDEALWSEARIRVHQGETQIWTKQARSLRGVMNWKGWPLLRIPGQWCGVDQMSGHHTNVA